MRLVTHIELQDFDLKRINHLAKAAGTTTEEYIRKALGLAVERSAEDEQREIQLEVIGYENWLSELTPEERERHLAKQKNRHEDPDPQPTQIPPTTTPDEIAFEVFARSLNPDELEVEAKAEIEKDKKHLQELLEELERRKKANEE